jgi:hypothetical protein
MEMVAYLLVAAAMPPVLGGDDPWRPWSLAHLIRVADWERAQGRDRSDEQRPS